MNHTKGKPGSRKRPDGSFPVRMCVICRMHKEKDALIRIPSGKASGRGMYICREEKCLLAGRKRGLIGETDG